MTETRYQCEQCGQLIDEETATLESFPGHDGIVTLAFCKDCSDD